MTTAKQRTKGKRVSAPGAIRRFQKAQRRHGLSNVDVADLTNLSQATVQRLAAWRPGHQAFLQGTLDAAMEFVSAFENIAPDVESDSTQRQLQLPLPQKIKQDPERKDRAIDELQRRVAALESSVSTLHAVVMRLVAQGGGR